MGVGQPLSMKLKNVHLPQPHPNGGFREPSLGERLELPLCLAALVIEYSEVSTCTPAAAVDTVDFPFVVVMLLYWFGTAAAKRVHCIH